MGRFWDAVHDLRQIHLVVVEAGVGVGFGGVAVPAVLGAGAVLHFAVVGDAVAGGAGGLEEVLHQVDGVVEEVGVVGADVEVELALEFGAEGLPVALQDGVEVEVVVPVGGGLVVDGAGLLVEDGDGVAVGALG